MYGRPPLTLCRTADGRGRLVLPRAAPPARRPRPQRRYVSTPECPIREYSECPIGKNSGVPPCVSTHVRAAGFQLQRLKDKLGDKSNASSEVRLGLGA